MGNNILEDLTELEVVAFKKIPNPDFPVLEESVVEDLSKDQKYTYKVSHAIIKGEMPPDLANQEPGPLGVRWGTLANRMMRKYVSTKRPSRKFQDIISGIILFWGSILVSDQVSPKVHRWSKESVQDGGMVQETKQTITRDHSESDAKEWLFCSF